MLSFNSKATEDLKRSVLYDMYANKEAILKQMPLAKSDRTKKKLMAWVDKMEALIQAQFDKAS